MTDDMETDWGMVADSDDARPGRTGTRLPPEMTEACHMGDNM